MIVIGDNVNISHNVKMYTGGHDIESEKMSYSSKPIFIQNNVWIFPNVIIMPGVTIFEKSVVLPGSVVTKSFTGSVVLGGNPAVVLKESKRQIGYQINHNSWFSY